MKKRRLKKTKKFIQAACLAAGLTMAGWAGGPAVNQAEAASAPPAIEVSGTISPTTSLTDIVVIYSLNTSGAPDMIYHDSGVADVVGGNTGSFSFQVEDDPSWYDGESYTVIGVYDESGNGTGDSVCIGIPEITGGNTWDSYFAVNGDGITNYTEVEIVGYLQSDDGANLETFYADYFDTIAQDIGSDIPLWNFSNATANGTAHADSQVVPLPPALLLLGSGLFGLVAVRRRKKS